MKESSFGGNLADSPHHEVTQDPEPQQTWISGKIPDLITMTVEPQRFCQHSLLSAVWVERETSPFPHEPEHLSVFNVLPKAAERAGGLIL